MDVDVGNEALWFALSHSLLRARTCFPRFYRHCWPVRRRLLGTLAVAVALLRPPFTTIPLSPPLHKSPIAISISHISPSTSNTTYDFLPTHSTPDIRADCAACDIPAPELYEPLVASTPSHLHLPSLELRIRSHRPSP